MGSPDTHLELYVGAFCRSLYEYCAVANGCFCGRGFLWLLRMADYLKEYLEVHSCAMALAIIAATPSKKQ
jgi:hypothetical protein